MPPLVRPGRSAAPELSSRVVVSRGDHPPSLRKPGRRRRGPCAVAAHNRHAGRRCHDRATAPCRLGSARTRRQTRAATLADWPGPPTGCRIRTPRRRHHRSRKSSGSGIRLDVPDGSAGIGVARPTDSLVGISGGAPGSTPNAAAIDAAPACGRATIRHELDDVGEVDSGTRRPQAAATPPRRRQRIAEPTPRGVQPAGVESRRVGLESRPQDTGSDNVNGHDPNRNTRLRPSARRLAKETATFGRRLWRSARQHRPPHAPAAVGKEAP